MRDQFACYALLGVIHANTVAAQMSIKPDTIQQQVKQAYKLADAMMIAREVEHDL